MRFLIRRALMLVLLAGYAAALSTLADAQTAGTPKSSPRGRLLWSYDAGG